MMYVKPDKEVLEVLGIDPEAHIIPCVYDIRNGGEPEHKQAEGVNVSGIIDQLIYVTAKCTECYASDIIYTIRALTEAVDSGEDFMQLLAFRSMGVDSYIIHEFEGIRYFEVYDGNSTLKDAIQYYALICKNGATTLDRVNRCDSSYNVIDSVNRLNDLIRCKKINDFKRARLEKEEQKKEELFYEWWKQNG